MNQSEKANVILAVLMSSSEPVNIKNLADAFEPRISYEEVKVLLREMKFNQDVMILSEKSEFFQLIIKSEFQKNINLAFGKKPSKYSRSTMEALTIIAYKQPITRPEIDDIRGVTTNSIIFKSLEDRKWIKIIGTKDVPGKPNLYGTTINFLIDFDIDSLEKLPPLKEISTEIINEQLKINI
jgi:segregation and condensation protein B